MEAECVGWVHLPMQTGADVWSVWLRGAVVNGLDQRRQVQVVENGVSSACSGVDRIGSAKFFFHVATQIESSDSNWSSKR